MSSRPIDPPCKLPDISYLRFHGCGQSASAESASYAIITIHGDRTAQCRFPHIGGYIEFCVGLDDGEPAGIQFTIDSGDTDLIKDAFRTIDDEIDIFMDYLERVTQRYKSGETDAWNWDAEFDDNAWFSVKDKLNVLGISVVS